MSTVTSRSGEPTARSPAHLVRGGGGRRRCTTGHTGPTVILSVALTAAVAATLLLGGCRAADRVAASGAPEATSPIVTGSGAPDPLAGIDATVTAVERDLDADAGVADR